MSVATRVLVAAGDARLGRLLLRRLSSDGFAVEAMHSASEVLAALQGEAPALLLIDYALPDMNARELLAAAEAEKLAVPPFVVMTGEGQEPLAVEMLRAGAVDTVTKDDSFWDLLPRTVARVLAEQASRQRLQMTRRALADQGSILESIFDLVPVGLAVMQDRHFLRVNPALCELTGYAEAELVGCSSRMLYKDQASFLAAYKVAEERLETLGSGSTELLWLRKNGTTREILLSFAILKPGDGGTQPRLVVAVNDVTTDRERERKVQASETLHRTIVETAQEGVVLLDAEGRITFCNSRMQPLLGDPPEALIGRQLATVIDAEDVARLGGLMPRETTLDGQHSVVRLKHRDGSARATIASFAPIRDGEGGALAMFLDETALRAAVRERDEERERRHAILSSIADGFLAVDSAFRITYANEAAQQALTVEREALQGKDFWEIFPDARGTLFEQKYRQAMAEERALTFEAYYPTAPFTNWYSVRVYPFDDGLAIFFQIITERIEAAERQAHVTAMLRGGRAVNRLITTETRPQVILQVACNNLVEVMQYEEAWAVVDRERLGHVVAAKGEGPLLDAFQAALQAGDPPPHWQTILEKAGTHLLPPVEPEDGAPSAGKRCILASRIAFEDRPYGAVAVSADFPPAEEECTLFAELAGDLAFALYRGELETERQAAEQDLGDLLSQVPDMVYQRRLDGTAAPRNATCSRITGYSLQVLQERPELWLQMLHPEDRDRMLKLLKSGPGAANGREFEYRLRRADGTWRWLQSRMAPVRDADGQVVQYTCIDRDISDQKATAQALQASEARYRQLFEAANDPVFICELMADERLGRFVHVNDALCALLEMPREELLQRRLEEVSGVADADRPWAGSSPGRRLGAQVYESTLQAASQRQVPVEISVQVVQLQERRQVLCIARDLTERRRAEAERARLNAAIDQAVESVMITDADGIITYVNPACERNTGYSREELIGQKPGILSSGETPPEQYTRMWETLAAGEVWSGNFRNRHRDGTLIEWNSSIAPVRDEAGEVVAYVAVSRDVTEAREVERQVRQAHKMEAVGTLAGGIAHDFNNVLTVISGTLQLAQRPDINQQAATLYLQQALLACDRARDLVAQILLISRKSDEAHQVVELVPIIKETVKFMRASLPATIEIRLKLMLRQATVIANPTQLHQIIMNLCTNAHHAMQDRGGSLTLQLDALGTEADIELPGDLPPGAYVRLAVCDTGAGIEPALQERIFEPYFTTKAPGEGTGMGLAVVHGIVSGCGGAVDVESAPGQGSTFTIYLPRAEADPVQPSNHRAAVAGGSERLLLVDDEPAIATMGAELLRTLGYHVTAMTDSRQALLHMQKHGETIDCVLTDLTMPYMTGTELATEIWKLRPRLPILLWTGYNEAIGEQEASRRGFAAFLRKPFDLKDLSMVLRGVLGADEPA